MATRTRNPLVDDYLRELHKAATSLPASTRRELTEEITEHFDEALDGEASEADTRNELDRLGSPEQIVAEARERLGISSPRGGAFEWTAVCLLLIGGFFMFVGWIVGVVMLWSSRAWTLRDKLIGTLVIPGGLGGAVFVAGVLSASGSSGCSSGGTSAPIELVPSARGATLASVAHGVTAGCGSGPSGLHVALIVAGLLVLVMAPIFTAVYLGRRIRRPVVA